MGVFEKIEDIPETMPRYEMWRIAYERNPYLRHVAKDRLRELFDEVMLISMFWGVKGCPEKPTLAEANDNIQRFSNIHREMNHRGISMEEFRWVYERQMQAAQRLRLSSAMINWLEELEKHKRK